MSTKEDREDAGENPAGARQPAGATPGGAAEAEFPARRPDAHAPQENGRAEKLSARAFAGRWSIVAGACLFVAATFLLLRRMDAAFVAATLGIVAWFLNERNRLRPPGIEAEEKFRDEDEEFEDRDEV